MTGPAVTLRLPAWRDRTWADALIEAFKPAARRLAERAGFDELKLDVLYADDRPALLLGEKGCLLQDGDRPLSLAASMEAVLEEQVWPAWLAPALAARGVRTDGTWLPQAAARGLTLEDLEALAADGADEERIAWHLADRFPPRLSLLTRPDPPPLLSEEAARRAAAERAAALSGLPVPVPPGPVPDLAVSGSGLALEIGIRRVAFSEAEMLDWILFSSASSFVDPGLVVALCTDEQRIPRRLAVRALAGVERPVRIAERIIAEHVGRAWPVDLVAILEEVTGLAAQ